MRNGLLVLLLVGVWGCEQVANDDEFALKSEGITFGDRSSHPAVVGLMSGTGGVPFCTGTLIREDLVMTAAHCGTPARIGVGHAPSYNTSTRIERHYRHPNYVGQSAGWINDIALLKLSTPITNAETRPPLPPSLQITSSDINSLVLAVGFGENNHSGYYPGHKQEAYIPISNVRSTEIDFRRNSRGQNICRGDSGGPTFIERDGQEYVIGVTSTEMGNCTAGSSHTKVDKYSNWIASIAGEWCGNGICSATTGEDCNSCAADCQVCPSCDQLDCDDGNACTVDSCDPDAIACVHDEITCAADSNLCTDEYCDPGTGACVSEPANCDDGSSCTVDACNPADGSCGVAEVVCQGPAITDVTPGNGQTLQGSRNVNVSATVTADLALADVELVWTNGATTWTVSCDDPDGSSGTSYFDCSTFGDRYVFGVQVGTGDRSFYFRATDVEDNAELSPLTTLTFVPDRIPGEGPVIGNVTPENGPTQRINGELAVGADITDSEGVSKVELIWTNNGSTQTWNCDTFSNNGCDRVGDRYTFRVNIGTGNRTFQFRATDGNGDVTTAPAHNVNVQDAPPDPGDGQGPNISDIVPVNGATVARDGNNHVQVGVTVDDPAGVSEVKLVWTSGSTTWNVTCDDPNGSSGTTYFSCSRTGNRYDYDIQVGTGARSFFVTASDPQDNSSSSATRSITVTN